MLESSKELHAEILAASANQYTQAVSSARLEPRWHRSRSGKSVCIDDCVRLLQGIAPQPLRLLIPSTTVAADAILALLSDQFLPLHWTTSSDLSTYRSTTDSAAAASRSALLGFIESRGGSDSTPGSSDLRKALSSNTPLSLQHLDTALTLFRRSAIVFVPVERIVMVPGNGPNPPGALELRKCLLAHRVGSASAAISDLLIQCGADWGRIGTPPEDEFQQHVLSSMCHVVALVIMA
jgi:hypothetical protein